MTLVTLLIVALVIPVWIIAGAMIQLNRRMHHMSEALNRLAASAAALTSVASSAVAVINGISQQIRDAIDEDDAQEDGALGQLADSLDASAQDLSAAIEANTPNAPPTGADVPGAGFVDTGNSSGASTPPASPEPNSSNGSVSGSDSVAVVDDPETAPDDQDSTVG